MNFLFLVGVLIAYFVFVFDKMYSSRSKVNNAWEQVNMQLKRRFDLVPNLVETVKIVAVHEKNTLDDVTRVRNNYLQAQTPEEIMRTNRQMTSALERLLIVVENYPDLKTNVSFTNFQQELSRIEDKIIYARQFYNNTVMKYNDSILIFPNNIFAKPFGFRKIKYFNMEESERSIPKIDF